MEQSNLPAARPPLGGAGATPGRAARADADAGSGRPARLVLDALCLWWKLILPLALLLAAGGGLLAWSLFTPVYAATTWLQIQRAMPYLAYESRQTEDREDHFGQTEIELIRSPLVLGSVVERPEIADVPELARQHDKVDWLGESLKIKPIGSSELYTVSLECSDPEDSARIVNAVVDAYFQRRAERDQERLQKVLELLDREKALRAEELRRLRESVREAARKITGKDSSSEKAEADSSGQAALARLREQLDRAVLERQTLEARRSLLEGALRTQPVVVAESTVEQAVDSSPDVQRLKTLVQADKARLEELRAMLADYRRQPSYVRLYERVVENERALEAVRADSAKRVRSSLETALRARWEEQLASLRSEAQERQVQEQVLQKRVREELKNPLPGGNEPLEILLQRSELSQSQQVLDLVMARMTRLRTEQRAPAQVTLLKRATPPAVPVVAFPYRNVILAALAGLLLPVLATVLWERLARRVREPADLEEESRLAVVGEVAHLPGLRKGPIGSAFRRNPEDALAFEESINGLRTSLFLAEDLRGVRILAVTSAEAGEGKTSVAASLALSVAEALGEPVLLIDGDLRFPDVHSVLGTPPGPGLVEVLQGTCSVEEALVSVSENLCVLPAGIAEVSPHRLLGTEGLHVLLQQLLARYRYIVIDTPPVLAASESLVFAKEADACLVCAMRDVTRGDQVQKACCRLWASGCRIAGAVLSGVPQRRYRYRRSPYTKASA